MATTVIRVTSIDVPKAINLSVDDDAIIAIAMEPLRAIPVRAAWAVSTSNSVFIFSVRSHLNRIQGKYMLEKKALRSLDNVLVPT